MSFPSRKPCEPRDETISPLQAPVSRITREFNSTTVGTLVGLTSAGRALVSCENLSVTRPLEARSCIPLHRDRIGCKVVVLFAHSPEGLLPIVIGMVQEAERDADFSVQKALSAEVQADGERLVVSAAREIVLRCGEASITLTREGKVLLRGAYVSSRSAGVNRIKGATVEIN